MPAMGRTIGHPFFLSSPVGFRCPSGNCRPRASWNKIPVRQQDFTANHYLTEVLTLNPMRPCFLLLLAAALAWLSPARSAAQQKNPPNVIIIFADDMGYGDVSHLNPQARTATPHIDQLARMGIVFTNAHASASVCTPSRYGLLTGRYAWRSQSRGQAGTGFSQPLIEPGRPTLASLFKKQGYATAIVGKWHLGLGWQTRDGSPQALFNAQNGRSNVDYTKAVTHGPNSYGFDYSFIHPASLDMPPYVFLRNHLTVDPHIQLTSEIYPTSSRTLNTIGTESIPARTMCIGIKWSGGDGARSPVPSE